MDKAKSKIIFLGTSFFGADILEGIIGSGYILSAVFTSQDKPAGRKMALTSSPVRRIAEKYRFPVRQPGDFNELKLMIKEISPDLAIVSDYGQIIPKNILGFSKYGFLNVHPSLLPRYRGPSPIQSTILNGDKKTGVTIILMDEKIDHGPIASQEELISFNGRENYQELSKKLAKLGVSLLIRGIPFWLSGEIKTVAQNEKDATYTKIIKKEDGRIDWSKPAGEIERKIRAFSYWPGAFAFFKKSDKVLRVKIIDAFTAEKDDRAKISIKCGKDYLIIRKLQPEGRKIMAVEDFIRGYGKPSLF